MRNSSVRARARRRLISSSSVVRQLCGDGTAISGDAWFGIWWDDRAWSARVKPELSQVIHGLFTLGARPTSLQRSRLHLPRSSHVPRSEEHTSELQSLRHLVCRLLL